jgi:hypothetical protein
MKTSRMLLMITIALSFSLLAASAHAALPTLTVINGTGSGQYVPGTVTPISADTPAAGKVFARWTGGAAHVADVNSPNTIFYCYFTAVGLDVTAEDATSHGRIDMTVTLDNRVFIFEFKVVDIDRTPGTALDQVRQRGYAGKYHGGNAEITLIGMAFDRNKRNIVRFEWEWALEPISRASRGRSPA